VQEAVRLTDYAVETRYPGVNESVTEEERQDALLLAKETVDWVERLLAKAKSTPPSPGPPTSEDSH